MTTAIPQPAQRQRAGHLRLVAASSFRYTSGTAPTSRFFTDQMWDATTSLYYYVARYYDAVTRTSSPAPTPYRTV